MRLVPILTKLLLVAALTIDAAVAGTVIDLSRTIGTLPATRTQASGVTAGDYTCPTVHFDIYGRATAAANGSCGGSSPLTTKGDIYSYSTTNVRVPVGTDGYSIVADSSQAVGWKWAPSSGGNALTSNPLSQFALTTSAQLASVISDETGSGALCFATSPVFITPSLGVATGTSINKVIVTPPATSATLTIANGATLTASASATVSGTNTGDQTITLTGDATGSGTGSFAVNVGKINGVALSGLSTGLLKNTAGVLSSATAGTDYAAATNGTSGQILTSNGAGGFGAVATRSGSTSTVATASGTLTNGHCVSIDVSGNFVDAGGACTTGGGGGTVSSGTTGQIAYYASSGTVVSGANTIPSGTVVGTSDTQTLTNKTLTSGTNTFPTFNQNTTGSAATLATPRAIYGNNFDGSAALSQIIASTYGGTGNGFTKFFGATTSEKTYTLPNASANILTDNAAVTVVQGGTGVTSLTAYAPLFGGTTPTGAVQSGAVGTTGQVLTSNGAGALPTFQTPAAGGTVTSVAETFTGGIISVGGSPITTSGTLALTVAGTSGGIPYFSSSSGWGSSAVLAANAVVIGGGAGVAPSTTTALPNGITATTQPAFDNSTKVATTAYVDAANTALDSKPAVAYASTSALPVNTYSNGASGVGATLTGTSNGPLVIDGVTILVGQVGERVLVAGEATSANNGWYTITQQGVVAVSPYILTRATESDQAAEIGAGYLTSVIAPNSVTPGSSNNGKVFISVASDPFTVGTTSLTFSQVGSTYSAGNGLALSGSTFSIDTSITVDKTTAQTLSSKTLVGQSLPTVSGTSQGTGNINIDGVSYNDYNYSNGASTATYTPVITSAPASGYVRYVTLTVGCGTCAGVITMTWTNVSWIGTAGASTTTTNKTSTYACKIPSSGNALCAIVAEAY